MLKALALWQKSVRGSRKRKNNLQKLQIARLWLQYMEMVDILRRLLQAKWIGDWALHLQSLFDMLLYLAASGHNLYLKSVHIYLQKMSKLQDQNPEVYNHFSEGLHVVWRSGRPGEGLSTDLVIEQCLMSNIKTIRGLTQGRGLIENQRLVWFYQHRHVLKWTVLSRKWKGWHTLQVISTKRPFHHDWQGIPVTPNNYWDSHHNEIPFAWILL